jgi:molybdenum cofactor synthesis domain-containing protein
MSPTAAALVIGNEILTGKVQETNVTLLARELFSMGVELQRVVVCRDEIPVIVEELDQLRRRHDWVITSGGVGPTHDDVTIAAVARSLGRRVVRSPELEAKIRELVGARLKPAHLSMADVPENSELLVSEEAPWPTILVDNVFVMPGLPRIFEAKLPSLRARIGLSRPFLSRAVYTVCRETDIAELLRRIATSHHDVTIGSYPVIGEAYNVRLTFDGKDGEAIDRAVGELLAELPPDKIVRV